MWQRSTGDDLLLEHIVEKWRLSASGGGVQATQFAEALEAAGPASDTGYADDAGATGDADDTHHIQDPLLAPRMQVPVNRAPLREALPPRRDAPASPMGSSSSQTQSGGALRSLRERLSSQRPPSR
jgi:hypothetical protein